MLARQRPVEQTFDVTTFNEDTPVKDLPNGFLVIKPGKYWLLDVEDPTEIPNNIVITQGIKPGYQLVARTKWAIEVLHPYTFNTLYEVVKEENSDGSHSCTA